MRFLWTTLYVRDLDKSIAFYSDLVGLKTLRRFPAGPGVEIAFMGNGTDNETLVELLVDGKRTVNHTDSISIGFAVESADGMLETLKSKSIPVHGNPVETASFKFFTVKDPDGVSVQFFQQK